VISRILDHPVHHPALAMSSSSTDVMQVLANLEYASHLSGDRLLIRHHKIVNCVQTEPYHEYDSFTGDPTYREFVIGPADGRPALVDFDQLSGEVESADFIPHRQAAHTLNRTVFESLARYVDDALRSILAVGICNGVVVAIGADQHVDDWFQEVSDGSAVLIELGAHRQAGTDRYFKVRLDERQTLFDSS